MRKNPEGSGGPSLGGVRQNMMGEEVAVPSLWELTVERREKAGRPSAVDLHAGDGWLGSEQCWGVKRSKQIRGVKQTAAVRVRITGWTWH